MASRQHIDNFSGNFKVYPVVNKSEVPTTTRRYYKDSAHDGVTLATGSVMYSDNEVVINWTRDRRAAPPGARAVPACPARLVGPRGSHRCPPGHTRSRVMLRMRAST